LPSAALAIALRAERDSNSELAQPLADRIRGHAKDARHRQQRSHHAQNTQRNGRHSRGEKNRLAWRLETSPRSRVILGPFDILVDIGVPAEKEVIQ